jgi:SP family facilitated glucose transporter-like MFS transporter 8
MLSFGHRKFIVKFYMIAANLSIAATGAMLGWTSPILPVLQLTGGPLGSPITSEQGSWIGSLVAIGAIGGSFLGGHLGERYDCTDELFNRNRNYLRLYF